LDGRESFRAIQEKYKKAVRTTNPTNPTNPTGAHDTKRRLLVRYGVPIARALDKVISRQPHVERGARWMYTRLPEKIRVKLRKAVKGG
jgi:hypothetical protein